MSRKKKHDHVNHERWLVSYADFITLLFAFFVVMFATSQSDRKKVQQVEYSIRTAFESMGIFPAVSKDPNLGSIAGSPLNTTVVMGDDLEASPKVMEDLYKIKQQMEHLLAAQIAHHTVAIRIGRDGLIISLREVGFFESGSATPKPQSLSTVHAIAEAIAKTPYNVRIEGHTDNVPIHNDLFASNWELSTARATMLTKLFIESDHLPANRLAAAGYAEYHPVASNSTMDGRSRNRRVDIIILPTQPNIDASRNIVVSSPAVNFAHPVKTVVPVASHRIQEVVLPEAKMSAQATKSFPAASSLQQKAPASSLAIHASIRRNYRTIQNLILSAGSYLPFKKSNK